MTSLYPAVDASSAPSREKTRFAVALLALFLFAAATTAENAAYAVYPADEPTATEASGPASDETASADSNEKKQEAQWFRLQYENNAPVELQTSIVRFDGEFTTSEGQTNPVSVDLIGAIHLADAAYYEQLNKTFAEYDVVVFELVAPKGTDIKALVEEERAAKEKASSVDFHGKSLPNVVHGRILYHNSFFRAAIRGIVLYYPAFRGTDEGGRVPSVEFTTWTAGWGLPHEAVRLGAIPDTRQSKWNRLPLVSNEWFAR